MHSWLATTLRSHWPMLLLVAELDSEAANDTYI